MAVSYIQSISKLKGRENYDEWSYAVENLLVLDNLLNYIKSESAGFEVKSSDDAKVYVFSYKTHGAATVRRRYRERSTTGRQRRKNHVFISVLNSAVNRC